jgi:hypothetical protein
MDRSEECASQFRFNGSGSQLRVKLVIISALLCSLSDKRYLTARVRKGLPNDVIGN